jgi:hypothetical protein
MMPLIPILISALPSLASLFKNAPAQKAAEIAAQVAQEVFGTSDPAEVKARLEATPADGETIRKRLEVELASLQTSLADVQDARASTVQLAGMQSAMMWGAPIVSTLVMIGFVAFSYLALTVGQEKREITLYLLGAWQGLAGAVVGYWVGSSASSRTKDAALANLAKGRGND